MAKAAGNSYSPYLPLPRQSSTLPGLAVWVETLLLVQLVDLLSHLMHDFGMPRHRFRQLRIIVRLDVPRVSLELGCGGLAVTLGARQQRLG